MNKNLENIKSRLGTDCTHISYVKTKVKDVEGVWQNVDAIKAVLLNDIGGKSKVEIVLPVNFGELSDLNFDEIYNYIKEKKYVS
jgi:hypothetical protein